MTYYITRASLAAAGACWLRDPEPGRDRARLEAIVPEAGLPVTPESLEAALAAGVEPRDVAWALIHAAGLPGRVQRLAACRAARRALARVAAPDPRSVAAVDVAERHAIGEATDVELADARAAAWAADEAAAGSAAWAAARAAWAAARAAWAAARAAEAAAESAADAATNAAAESAAMAADAATDAAAESAARSAAWLATCHDLVDLATEDRCPR